MMVIFSVLLLLCLSTVFCYPLESIKDISLHLETNLSLTPKFQRYNFRVGEYNVRIANITNILTYQSKEIDEQNKSFTYNHLTVISMFNMFVLTNFYITRALITAEAEYASLSFKQNDTLSLIFTLSPSLKDRFRLMEWDVVQYDYYRPLFKDIQIELSKHLEESFKDIIGYTLKDYPLSIAEYYFKQLISSIETHGYFVMRSSDMDNRNFFLKLTNIKYNTKTVSQLSRYQCNIEYISMKANVFEDSFNDYFVSLKNTRYGLKEIVIKEVHFSPYFKDLGKNIKILFYEEYRKQIRVDPFDPSLTRPPLAIS